MKKVRQVESFEDADGRVRRRQVRADDERDVAVGQVVSLVPAVVNVPGFGHVRVRARSVGLVASPGDRVLVVRVRGGVVVVGVVEMLGGGV